MMMSKLLSILRVPAVLVVLLAARPALGQCGGCPGGVCPVPATAAVEEEHCHWLEVQGLVPGGPAELLGIQPGDIVHSFGGRPVGCLADLQAAKAAVTGDSADVAFLRGSDTLRLRFPAAMLGAYLKEWEKDVVLAPDARVIEGVPALGWSTGKTSSFLAALEAATVPLGVKADYTFLGGASGAAFRLHFHEDWCPSSPYPGCGFQNDEVALAVAGLGWTGHEQAPDGKNRPQMLAAIRASIDRGVPVLAWRFAGGDDWEWGLVVGYQREGTELLVRGYSDKRKGYDIAPDFPQAIVILEPKGKKPDEMASVRASFGISREMLETERYGQYWSGLAAFDRWVERLGTDDFAGADSAAFSEVIQANYWITSRLVDDRRTGIEYLRDVRQRLLPGLAEQLNRLELLYAEEVDIIGSLVGSLPCPETVTRPDQWTRELKDRQVAALVRARALEKQALAVWTELAAAE